MEPNLYMSKNVLLLYVDDILLFYRVLEGLNIIKEKLKAKYRMTGLGLVKRFLGLDVKGTKQAMLSLKQHMSTPC